MTKQSPPSEYPDLRYVREGDDSADAITMSVKSIKARSDKWKARAEAAEARCARLEETGRAAIKAIDDLISQSYGVSGLHLNGDDARWDELLAGGKFEEWLLELEDFREALSDTAQQSDK